MMMVGFSWLFIGLAFGLSAPLFVPGRRDAQLPVAMLVASTGAFMGALFSSIVFDSPDRTGKPSIYPEWPGLILSIVGGAVAFGFYVATMRRPLQPRGA